MFRTEVWNIVAVENCRNNKPCVFRVNCKHTVAGIPCSIPCRLVHLPIERYDLQRCHQVFLKTEKLLHSKKKTNSGLRQVVGTCYIMILTQLQNINSRLNYTECKVQSYWRVKYITVDKNTSYVFNTIKVDYGYVLIYAKYWMNSNM